jgi:hypothetical protein
MSNNLNDEIRSELPKLIGRVQALRDIAPNPAITNRLDNVARDLDAVLELIEIER